jgi:demethylmenaquinone methyltransferase/2-methoxy-6-polyprenyl-1,4-benzoquinol methylase
LPNGLYATIRRLKEYYDTRAPEYDEWYRGTGVFADRDRPDWDAAVVALERDLATLPPARTLDVACGTGFLTRHLPGEVVGLDQSARMLGVAAERLPGAELVQGDALALPFSDSAFERVFTGHFYGHLQPGQRERFLAEALRVAAQLVVVDAAARPDQALEQWQTRVLNDGSRFEVYKRYFEAETLATELGGGRVFHRSAWFVGIVVEP